MPKNQDIYKPPKVPKPDYSSYSGNELVKIKRAGMKVRKK